MRREKLEALRHSAMAKAESLLARKGADYAWWGEYPPIALAGLNFVKAKRILELSTKVAANPESQEANEPLEDSCIDLINYASFLYALTIERKEGKKKCAPKNR